jgi:Flp pilus assembly protein TadD
MARIFQPLVMMLVVTGFVGCSFSPHEQMLSQPKASKNGALEAQLSYARLNERQGNLEEAKRVYEYLLTKHKGNQTIHHRLAIIASQNRLIDEADHHFQQALAAGPPTSELLSDLGYYHYLQDRHQHAEAKLREAIAVDSSNQSAHANLGLALGEQGRFEESLAEFKLASDEATAYANLAYVYTMVGDFAAAEATYHHALSLNNELKPAAEALLQLAQHKHLHGSGAGEAVPTSQGGIVTAAHHEARPLPAADQQKAEQFSASPGLMPRLVSSSDPQAVPATRDESHDRSRPLQAKLSPGSRQTRPFHLTGYGPEPNSVETGSPAASTATPGWTENPRVQPAGITGDPSALPLPSQRELQPSGPQPMGEITESAGVSTPTLLTETPDTANSRRTDLPSTAPAANQPPVRPDRSSSEIESRLADRNSVFTTPTVGAQWTWTAPNTLPADAPTTTSGASWNSPAAEPASAPTDATNRRALSP